MASPIPQLKQFLYSHYFFGGLRQSIGVLLPVIILGRFFGHYDIGVIASMGATCVAIIDQPGGPRRYRNNEMLGGIALGTVTVGLLSFTYGFNGGPSPNGEEWRSNLIDEERILESNEVPHGPLGLVIWVDNQYAALTPHGVNPRIVVDHPPCRVRTARRRYDREPVIPYCLARGLARWRAR